ncbi:MAG TPA: hypothetical protein VGB66_13705, partial [Longimicrobium sp.]
GADRSYGVEVARLAGLPSTVVSRARQILRELESNGTEPRRVAAGQLTLFEPDPHPAVLRLRGVDVNQITPMQALALLAELADAARS